MRCPNGHFLFTGPKLQDATGRAINKMNPAYLRDKQTKARCPKCDVTWNVFGAAAPPEAAEVPTYNASHGCARVPMWSATWVYSKADIGTTVHVYH